MKIPVNLALVVGASWLFWVMLPRFLERVGLPVKMETLGQWGDTFGALNAAFSAAAVIGVLATLRMQSKEIADQQKQIDRQSDRLERSEFESMFFQLFGLFRELRDQVVFTAESNSRWTGTARGAFEAADRYLMKQLTPELVYPGQNGDIAARISENYSHFVHRQAEGSFGPYFRVLYTILRRVSENHVLTSEEKAQYGNLVRSQLSSAEVAIIAANALTEDANNFDEFIIEFRLFKYLPEGPYRTWMERIYPIEAFTARD